MKRKQPSSSSTAAVKAMRDAASPIPVPEFVKLTERAAEFWAIVVRARARDEWTDADLTVAGDLCDCMADMRSEGIALKLEGYVLDNGRGGSIQNPRNQVLEVLTRRKIALMRMLQMQARAVQGSAAKVQAGRAAERSAASAIPEPESLLAAPTLQ